VPEAIAGGVTWLLRSRIHPPRKAIADCERQLDVNLYTSINADSASCGTHFGASSATAKATY
jgi:hypothetical protein